MKIAAHAEEPAGERSSADLQKVIRDLARFRYSLRRFLRFSENAARSHGVTPQQHQLMLGVAGFNGYGSATVSELAEFLQAQVHSVVGLVERAEQGGLVRTRKSHADRRVVVVSLTARGAAVLAKLSWVHHQQARQLRLLMDSRPVRRAMAGPRPRPQGRSTTVARRH